MSYCDPDTIAIHLPPADSCETLVYDEDGEWVASFYGSWTFAQIKHALEISNRAYEQGYERGRSEKVQEIKRVLDL